MSPQTARHRIARTVRGLIVGVAALGLAIALQPTSQAQNTASASAGIQPASVLHPHWTAAAAHDTSPRLSTLTNANVPTTRHEGEQEERAEDIPPVADNGFAGDPVVQSTPPSAAIGSTRANFEGLSNQDNFNFYGGRVNPPDTNGDVGRNQYVEMTNLMIGVYSKTGQQQLPPTPIGALWSGFAVDDCTDPSGDPVVLYDQLANRWILTQFTTRGFDDPTLPFYNCVAVSTSSDATGSYYRYAFSTGFNFPDYPKYGVWRDTYTLTTREFGPTTEYGIGVYGLEKNKMLSGAPARAVSYFIDGNDPTLLPLVGDGLLPADIDGSSKPANDAAIPLVGTQDDDWVYGATFDAVNIWNFKVKWNSKATSSLSLGAQLATAPFDTNFPCAPDSRDCLAQPGITDPTRYIDTLASRQRPTWRLAYRNFGNHESLVTNQTVEAAPGVAGARWYEIKRVGTTYSLQQQGTFAPADGVNRWMGSIAQDKSGNMALGYSVVNGTDVFPGIRYTGRKAGDPAGDMTLGEGTVINGSGVQTTTNSRWGDYTSMNVDPVDDCTMWYANEYYTAAGQASSTAGWQTRIASFRLPGC
ncbi:MAG: hypothetical protein ABJA81_10645 [Nocardioidaceae bacterium]